MKIKPFYIVLVGVCFTVTSAVVTHRLKAQNISQIEMYSEKAQNVDQRVEQLWTQVKDIERQHDTALLLAAHEKESNDLVQDYFQKVFGYTQVGKKDKEQHEVVEYSMLDKAIEVYKDERLDQINDLYFEKIEANKKIVALERDNAFYTNLALFLYTIGLILVLAKDVGHS